jgi:hypothetical protein
VLLLVVEALVVVAVVEVGAGLFELLSSAEGAMALVSSTLEHFFQSYEGSPLAVPPFLLAPSLI